MAITQASRNIHLTTPFGADVLLLRTMSGIERISGPFELDLALVSEKENLDPDTILGKPVVLSFATWSGGKRFFHGFVTEFAQTGYERKLHAYRAVVRPWLWFLTRSADCRIFQKKSVPDIFEQVLKAHGMSDYYKLKLKAKYPALEYCVQYRETDFNFVSRLLEQAGIRYYFEHLEDQHEMVLTDDNSQHVTGPGYETVPFFPPDTAQTQRTRDHLCAWSFSKSVQAGAYATRDYDFEVPTASVSATASSARKHAHADLEIFDFPAGLPQLEGGHDKKVEHATDLAKVRIEELQAAYMVAHGSGDAAGLAPGLRFKLAKYPRDDLNIEYLITRAEYSLTAAAYKSGDSGGGDEFSVSITAIDARTAYRPPRITPKPIVQGAQTAVVVGPAKTEIFTDKYGRVKVQFRWDRQGKSNENSSYWIRVAQVWAGKGWGAIHVPRVGQEVIVSFLEGDPDQPIITGRVYNGEAMPPYDLPGAATRSGVRSRSTPDGAADAFNEIRFEDKKDSEEIHIQAQKDLKLVVKNDEAVTISKNRSSDIGENEALTVGKDQKLKVGANQSVQVDKDRTMGISGEEQRSVGKKRSTSIGDDDELKVGKKYVLSAADEITLETGAAKIVMKKNGDIEISGKNIKLTGSAQIEQSANQKVTIDGMQVKVSGTQIGIEGQAKTEVKGTMLDLSANGIASLKGSLTKIG